MSKSSKSKSKETTGKDIPFTCVAKDARSVFLVGSFNNWDPGATPMHRGGGDEWLAVVCYRSSENVFF